ncbi:MAG: VOC family protein [Actinomycetales bacterium]|nr:VOC family protein [Actinomycetales bacterium]
MSLQTTTHLNFRGDARAALDFYQSVFGGDLVAVTYAQAGAVEDPAEAEQIMWGQVSSPAGFRVMAYDAPASRPWERGQAPFFVSVRADDAGELEPYWARLAQGSTVIVDLAPAAWAPLYGMLVDPFGVTWVLDVAVAYGG